MGIDPTKDIILSDGIYRTGIRVHPGTIKNEQALSSGHRPITEEYSQSEEWMLKRVLHDMRDCKDAVVAKIRDGGWVVFRGRSHYV